MKKARKGDLPSTKEEWVKYVNICHDNGLELRKKHEFQWVVNLSYYKGYQNLLFDPIAGVMTLAREQVQPLIINRIGSYIEARHSKLTKNRPVPRVLPNSPDREDSVGAKYSDYTLMHIWRKIDMESVYDRLVMQTLICGTGFMETLWDAQSGDKLQNIRSNEAKELIFSEEGIDREEVFMGEISSKAKSAFSIIPANEMIPDIKDQPYIITRDRMPISYLNKIFPDLDIPPESTDSITTEYERLVERMGSPMFLGYSTMEKMKQDSLGGQALVKTMWIKPNDQYENGVVCVVIGKKLALLDAFPNNFGDNVYPYVKFYEKEDGFSFWNQSSIERLIPIQKAINTIKQKKIKNIVLMANGKWLLAKGSQVNEEAITDEEGEVIEWNPAVPEPKQAMIAPLPNYVAETESQLITDFRDAGGQRETTFAPSSNLTAGVAMQVQAELTDEIINPTLRRLAKSMEKVANQQLLLADEEYIEPRKIKIIGTEGPMAVQWISNLDLRHHTDVHIEIESLFPEFRGQKQQKLLDLWDRRVITDPAMFLKAYRDGSFDAIINNLTQLEDKIWLDISRIKQGKVPEFNPYDNHGQYVTKMMDFINSPEFMKMIPERKQLAMQVLQQHLQMLQQTMAQAEPQMEQNQNAVNTPSGPQVTT